MESEYLKGFITVEYGIDTVFLRHKVKGRFSQLSLGEGDSIEVLVDDEYKKLTVDQIQNHIVSKVSENHTEWNKGQSHYEGNRARVQLNPNTTRHIEYLNKQSIINDLFKAVEQQEISYQDAAQILLKWEKAYED